MKKYIKHILLLLTIIVIFILGFLIYKNMFSDSVNTRYKDIENYKLTNDEKNSAKDKIKELEKIKEVQIYIKSKIIKIVVKLDEDIDFDIIKTKANEVISCFSKENLLFYDIEFFVDSSNKESEVYPQIGYKFKAEEEFAW